MGRNGHVPFERFVPRRPFIAEALFRRSGIVRRPPRWAADTAPGGGRAHGLPRPRRPVVRAPRGTEDVPRGRRPPLATERRVAAPEIRSAAPVLRDASAAASGV